MTDAVSRWVLTLLFIFNQSVQSSPLWTPQAPSGDFGRNIRELPCVSRRTGETGVCMFAYSCAKKNGTHLGTCIDRFYFGSCCKIANTNIDLAAPLDSNSISEEPVLGISSTESYLLSTFQTVQLVKNTSSVNQQVSSTTSLPTHDIIPPVRKPPKPQVNITKPVVSGTKKPAVASLAQSSTNSHIETSGTQHPISPSLSIKPTKRPINNSNLSSSSNDNKPTPMPSITRPTGKPVLSNSKPNNVSVASPILSKPTKPTPSISVTNPPTKPFYVSKPKPQVSIGSNKVKPSVKPTLNKTNQSYVSETTDKIPTLVEKFTIKPPVKVPKPTQKPSSSKPAESSKPVIPKPTKPTNISSSSASKPTLVNKPLNSTKPSITLIPTASTKPPTKKPTSPVYVEVPLTSTQATKVTTMTTTISNEIIPASWNISTVSSVEFEEEVSNLINGSSQPTDLPPLLVTWTTVDEVPVKPLIKPSSTPSTQNKTKIPSSTTTPIPTTTTIVTTPTTTDTWVEVLVSTHGPTHSSSETIGLTKPSVEIPLTTTTASSVINDTTSEGKLPSSSPTLVEEMTTTESSINSTSIESQSTVGLNQTYNQSNETQFMNLNTSKFTDVCGRRLFPQSRIVGGDQATFGKWPWQISLRQWRTSTYLHKCGAALLNENWAITAAHCVENVPPSDLLLRLGEHDLSLEDEPYGYQERRVQIVASHPQFDSRTFEYDLALLRFYEPVTFQPNVIPVCVPQDDTNFVGSTAYVTGWGRLYEDGPLPSVLQEVSVPVINNTVCETMYRAAGYIEHIPEIFICAGWKKGGFDSCEGDSGGPMVIQRPDRRWLLAGVISWGIGCAEPNQPGVYTRISEFREWINQILQF
uniref:Peptidase S1 domain-containing protein n=1 Tax=Clastoptera arizonana TaxID=38151 RepID=A0A1B6D6T6_9HEMI